MTATRTLYRRANVSQAEATASLFARNSNVDLVSFEKKAATAEEATAAGVKEGELVYAATIRVAEFPPAEGEETSEAPEEPKEESKDEAPAEESKSDDSDSSDPEGGDKPFGGEDKGGEDKPEGAKPEKMDPDHQIIHLLQQLLDAVRGGDPLGAGPDAGPDAGLGLPDVGAPGKGDMVPPPGGHPGGPAGAGAPLPPPVHEKSPIGTGAFSHVADRAEVSMIREDAGEVNNATIIAEAATHAPTHRVAKIQRTGIAQVGDDLIDLAEAGVALVTLVSK